MPAQSHSLSFIFTVLPICAFSCSASDSEAISPSALEALGELGEYSWRVR